jgi:O-antigen/teichoic acid export membrane protein
MAADSTSTASDPLLSPDALTQAARRGTPVVLLGHLLSQLLGFGTLAILYRLLEPKDYGLLGMVLPAVMLPRMAATLGPGVAVLQQQRLSQQQLSSLFWLQSAAGALAAVVTVAIGGWMAAEYQQMLLLWLSVALAAGTLCASLGNQHQALLERDLRFRTGAALRLAGQFVACAGAITYAWFWPDVWALVIQHVAELVVLWLGSWLLVGWWPDWPAPRRGANQPHLRFSVAYSVSMLLQFVGQNIEKLLLPFAFGLSAGPALGLYSQSFGLMIKPVYLLTTPLTGVMISSLAKTQPGSELFTNLVARFNRLAAILLFPSAVGLTLVAPDVMLLLGGPQWQPAGLLFRWLAPSLAAIGLGNLAIFVLAARGQGRMLAISTAIWLLLIAQGTGFGFWWSQQLPPPGDAYYRAVLGIAAGFTLMQTVVWCVPFLWFTFRSVGVAPLRVLAALWPSLRAALLMGTLVFIAQRFALPAFGPAVQGSPLFRLLASAALGAAVYVALAWRELSWLRREWGHAPVP